jgi:hypothetical protein
MTKRTMDEILNQKDDTEDQLKGMLDQLREILKN